MFIQAGFPLMGWWGIAKRIEYFFLSRSEDRAYQSDSAKHGFTYDCTRPDSKGRGNEHNPASSSNIKYGYAPYTSSLLSEESAHLVVAHIVVYALS